jgi:hypothetical protein
VEHRLSLLPSSPVMALGSTDLGEQAGVRNWVACVGASSDRWPSRLNLVRHRREQTSPPVLR